MKPHLVDLIIYSLIDFAVDIEICHGISTSNLMDFLSVILEVFESMYYKFQTYGLTFY